MQLLLVLYTFFGALLTVVAIPLIKDKIKPNGLYGFRVAKTMNNPEAWYAVNRHFGKRLVWIGLIILLASIGLYFIPGISLDAYALGMLAVFVVAFGVGVAQSARFMNQNF